MFSKAYDGEATKKSSVFEWHKRFKEISHFEISNEENTHHFHLYRGYCSLWIHSTRPVNQDYYVEILKPLHEAVHTKVLVIWPSVWILRHDNAPAHKDLSVKQFLTQKTITEMEYPRYSSDLAPNDFRLLPKMSASKGLRFQDTESPPPPKKKRRRHWNLFHSKSSKNVIGVMKLSCVNMGGTCSTHGTNKKYVQILVIKRVLKVWTAFIWLRTGASEGLL